MRSGQFYDELSDLALSLYKGIKDFKGWKLQDKLNSSSGLSVAIYEKDNVYLFAIKGTDIITTPRNFINDIRNDIAMYRSRLPNQYYQAKKYYESIKTKYAPIIFTGYSLGWSIAQLLGNEFGNEAICFQPYAGGTMVQPKHTQNIINFGNIYDPVFMEKVDKHLGQIYLIPIKRNNNLRLGDTHLNYGKPSTAEKYNGTLEDNKQYLHRNTQEIQDYITKGILNNCNNILGRDNNKK